MELKVFKIPKPDKVLFLDVPYLLAKKLVGKKNTRAYTKGKKRDIHESDRDHLRKAYLQAIELTRQRNNWQRIKCYKGKEILSISEISDKIYFNLKKFL